MLGSGFIYNKKNIQTLKYTFILVQEVKYYLKESTK